MNYQIRQYNYLSNKFKVIVEFGATSDIDAIKFVKENKWQYYIDKKRYRPNSYFTLNLDSAIRVFKLPEGIR